MLLYTVSHTDRRVPAPTYRQTWTYRFFFGAENEGIPNRYGERPYTPALLVKNIRILPRLFYAGISMFVMEDIASELRGFDNVDLNRAEWHRVYDWPVDEASIIELEGPSPPFDRPEFHDITEDTPFHPWLRSLMRPPPPELRERQVCEVLAPRLESVAEHFPCTKRFNIPHPIFNNKHLELQTSPELHRVYPLVKVGWSAYACVEEVYRVLEPHVKDPDLFIVTRLEM